MLKLWISWYLCCIFVFVVFPTVQRSSETYLRGQETNQPASSLASFWLSSNVVTVFFESNILLFYNSSPPLSWLNPLPFFFLLLHIFIHRGVELHSSLRAVWNFVPNPSHSFISFLLFCFPSPHSQKRRPSSFLHPNCDGGERRVTTEKRQKKNKSVVVACCFKEFTLLFRDFPFLLYFKNWLQCPRWRSSQRQVYFHVCTSFTDVKHQT